MQFVKVFRAHLQITSISHSSFCLYLNVTEDMVARKISFSGEMGK